ncbi:hypothetical protein DCS_01743 [Drechmeria coniospora]|uniref:Uncharacterized protein n=1 Tax=Drechmeria coniospora TaxID=98403 RepID=A0A151GU06_DRECN|nr:hypothetical protein DCS_01743 [Drechmeria coniospora]KYK60606.1 hypothetical protein DCS_01743 [Drechmeria coniospora]ODA80764.1 hypothetical protein RJ55_03723 [Drechmeria coniospora]
MAPPLTRLAEGPQQQSPSKTASPDGEPNSHSEVIVTNSSPNPNPNPMLPSHLIVVCCHGIWLGGPSRGHDESEWLIAPFQAGETATFIRHIEAGVRLHAEDRDHSVLMFSGAPTRPETDMSEAQSYVRVAMHNAYWSLLAPPVWDTDILLEERALDSYSNILFSLTRFRARIGRWPENLTLVGHAFKQRRLESHLAAIGFPRHRTRFHGIDPPHVADRPDILAGIAAAEREWAADPHGRGASLAGKRRQRNPHDVWQGVFEEGIDDTAGLLTSGRGFDETLVDNATRPWC